MMVQDAINGLFEFGGGILCWLNVRRILKDKKVEGVDWRVSGFFACWGWWNCLYYPSLNQWCSFLGGAVLVIANSTWVGLAVHYQKINEMKKSVKLEKKLSDEFAHGWLARFYHDWRTHKRYESEAQAIQAHEGLNKTGFYRKFDWRIVSPLGVIGIPANRPILGRTKLTAVLDDANFRPVVKA